MIVLAAPLPDNLSDPKSQSSTILISVLVSIGGAAMLIGSARMTVSYLAHLKRLRELKALQNELTIRQNPARYSLTIRKVDSPRVRANSGSPIEGVDY
jgi:hypothetical protein